MSAICSTRSHNTIKTWVVDALQQILTPPFITVDVFALVVQYIYSYVFYFILFPLTMMTA